MVKVCRVEGEQPGVCRSSGSTAAHVNEHTEGSRMAHTAAAAAKSALHGTPIAAAANSALHGSQGKRSVTAARQNTSVYRTWLGWLPRFGRCHGMQGGLRVSSLHPPQPVDLLAIVGCKDMCDKDYTGTTGPQWVVVLESTDGF
jgi:hypothetical protein